MDKEASWLKKAGKYHYGYKKHYVTNEEGLDLSVVTTKTSVNNLVLGQIKTNQKSNEITATPKLLELLSIKDSVVTIDAMGCQTDIASDIIAKEADYILAVKGNQPQLLEMIEDEFRFRKDMQTAISETLDHVRIETSQ